MSTFTDIPEQVVSECSSELDSLNPFNELYALMETVTTSVSDRVMGDARYTEAKKVAESCSGLVTDSVTRRREIVDQVGKISSDFSSGGTTADMSIKSLTALLPVAATIDWTIEGGCDEVFMTIERSLVSEYQQKYLEDNPGFIEGLLEKFRPIVESYTKV